MPAWARLRRVDSRCECLRLCPCWVLTALHLTGICGKPECGICFPGPPIQSTQPKLRTRPRGKSADSWSGALCNNDQVIDMQIRILRQQMRIQQSESGKPDLEQFSVEVDMSAAVSVKPSAQLAEIRTEIARQLDLPDEYLFLQPNCQLPISRAQEQMETAARARDFWCGHGAPTLCILIDGYIEGEIMKVDHGHDLKESRSIEFKSLAEPVSRGIPAKDTVKGIIDRGCVRA